MLFLSSTIGHTSILGIALKLLQSTPPETQLAYELISLIPAEASSWNVRIRVAFALVKHNQVRQSERLIDKFDAAQYIQHTYNVAVIKSLFNLLPHVQEAKKTLELFDLVESNKNFDQDSFIGLKLRIANTFIRIGKGDAAEKVLKSIPPAKINNQSHITLLAHYYINLSKFESAMNVFNLAEQKGMIHHPHFFVFKAVNQFCLNDIKQAKSIIDADIDLRLKEPLNLFWKAKFCNYAGQHNEASLCIETALNHCLNGPLAQKCFCLVEKGNTLRSLEKINEAITCYQKAVENDIGALHWLWVAYFEYAMTLVYLGKIDDAFSIALKGCHYKSYQYNSKYNPCSILSGFLSHRLNRSPETPVHYWADGACLWPFPFMPYKIWMLILAGISLEEKHFYNEARDVCTKILKTNVCVSNGQVNGILYMEENDIVFHDSNTMDILQSKFWPNEFNWKTLRGLSDNEG